MKFNTDVLHAQQLHDPATGSHVSPLYQTSTFVLPNFDEAVRLNQNIDQGFVYSRFGNPTVAEFERKNCPPGKCRRSFRTGFRPGCHFNGSHVHGESRRPYDFW